MERLVNKPMPGDDLGSEFLSEADLAPAASHASPPAGRGESSLQCSQPTRESTTSRIIEIVPAPPSHAPRESASRLIEIVPAVPMLSRRDPDATDACIPDPAPRINRLRSSGERAKRAAFGLLTTLASTTMVMWVALVAIHRTAGRITLAVGSSIRRLLIATVSLPVAVWSALLGAVRRSALRLQAVIASTATVVWGVLVVVYRTARRIMLAADSCIRRLLIATVSLPVAAWSVLLRTLRRSVLRLASVIASMATVMGVVLVAVRRRAHRMALAAGSSIRGALTATVMLLTAVRSMLAGTLLQSGRVLLTIGSSLGRLLTGMVSTTTGAWSLVRGAFRSRRSTPPSVASHIRFPVDQHHLVARGRASAGRIVGRRRSMVARPASPAVAAAFLSGVGVGALVAISLVPKADADATPAEADRVVAGVTQVAFAAGASLGTAGTPIRALATPVAATGRVQLPSSPQRENREPVVSESAAGSRASARDRARSTATTVQRPRFRGSLIVYSRPAGASVFINGLPVGKTPLALTDQAVGSRSVRVVLDGHEVWSTAAQVVAYQERVVQANLTQLAAQGSARP